MLKPILLIFLIATSAQAEWLCTQESSQRFGSDISACGIGEAKLESEARALALENAKAEFQRLCLASDDCRGHKVTLDPRRTDCKPTAAGVKCYRLVRFSIANELSESGPLALAEPKKILAPSRPARKNAKKNSFEPIRKGMTKSALIESFGVPHSIDDLGVIGSQRFNRMNFQGKYCVYFSCSATVGAKWVTDYSGFKPQYTAHIAPFKAKDATKHEGGVDLWDVSGDKAVKTQIPVEDVTDGVAVGVYAFSVGEKVPVVAPTGEILSLDSSQVQQAFKTGYRFRAQLKLTPDPQSTLKQQVRTGTQNLTACGLIYGPTGSKVALPCSEKGTAEVHLGERFDIHLGVSSRTSNQVVRLELSGKGSVESFYPRDVDRVSFSKDKKLVVAERNLVFNSEGKGALQYGWSVGSQDPPGVYKLRAYLGGEPVGDFSINIVPVARRIASSAASSRGPNYGVLFLLGIVFIVVIAVGRSRTPLPESPHAQGAGAEDRTQDAEFTVEWLLHCKVLGAKPSSSREEIRKAYLQAAKKYHPDKHGNHPLANAKFQEIQQAYEFLGGASEKPDVRANTPPARSGDPESIQKQTQLSGLVGLLILVPVLGSVVLALYNAFAVPGYEGQRNLFLGLGLVLVVIFGLPMLFSYIRRSQRIRSVAFGVSVLIAAVLVGFAIFWFVGALLSAPAWAIALFVLWTLIGARSAK